MATLTIRNLPDDLYAALKGRARQNRRSLNQQVLVWLEEAWIGMGDTVPRDVEEELAEIRRLRGEAPPMTVGEIDAAKREGRP